VAYRQPALRADIEAVRGVDCGEILRQLMDRDFVRMVGRSPDLGRPYLYGTTKRFLQYFGLRHLDDLPRAAELRPQTQGSRGPIRETDVAVNETIATAHDRIAAGVRHESHPNDLTAEP
jgi:segregation and condensation protein B